MDGSKAGGRRLDAHAVGASRADCGVAFTGPEDPLPGGSVDDSITFVPIEMACRTAVASPGSCPCPTRSAIAAKVDRCRTEAAEGRDCQNRSYSVCQWSSIANGRPVEAVTRRPHPLVGIDGQINDGAYQQDAHHEQ
ncbi:hypothetical protein [Nocardia abscessus]|uniref:hypothetical protein n=1 Tax=Nocardia abscessus TaxID=120957 RepID=UPI0024567BAA|nr:hypothetical protein [Nocardia abscessus]